MLKKHGLAALIIVIVLQLSVAAGMIASVFVSDSYTEKYGTEYKFKVSYFWTDEDGWLHCDLAANGLYSFRNERYSVVSVGSDGYAMITKTEEKPETSSYIKNRAAGYSIPEKCVYVKGLTIPEQATQPQTYEEYLENGPIVPEYPEAYIVAYIYNGRISVKNMYIDSVPVEEYFSQ